MQPCETAEFFVREMLLELYLLTFASNRFRKDTNRRNDGLPSVRLSHKFGAYYDSIHANTNLALIWTQRLTDNIILDCFYTLGENILDILAPEEELCLL